MFHDYTENLYSYWTLSLNTIVQLGGNMDVVSHALWGRVITRRRVNPYLAMTIGVMPDLVAFIPQSIANLVNGVERSKVTKDSVTSDLPLAWDIYLWSHSLFVVGIAFLILWWYFSKNNETTLGCIRTNSARNDAFFMIVPWLWHILIDIPGHTIQFFPTPFLHPFSDIMIDGVRWSTPWFFFPQIILVLGLTYFVHKKEQTQSNEN